MKILLVEDDRLLNHHLKSILQEESHQVYAAHQAEEALHFAEDYPIDVGIIDLGLPDMEGLSLIRQLRAKQIPFRELAQCRIAADQVIDGKVADPTGGATHYYASSIRAPAWSLKAKQTLKLGGHVFFKDVP